MASNFDPTDDHGMRVAIEKMKELEKEFNVFYAEAKRLSTVVGGYNILLNTKETKPLIERGVQLKERGLELHQQALFAFDEARVALDDPMRKALNEE